MVQWKSFLAGGVAFTVLASITTAEQISIPNQFAAGTPARAAEVNANFDVLVQESNAQDVRISALKGDVEKIGNVEQLFCSVDPRRGQETMNDLGALVYGFPLPAIRFRNDDDLASVTVSPAICVSLSDPATLIESDARQLAESSWRLRTRIDGAKIRVGSSSGYDGSIWFLYERLSGAE